MFLEAGLGPEAQQGQEGHESQEKKIEMDGLLVCFNVWKICEWELEWQRGHGKD